MVIFFVFFFYIIHNLNDTFWYSGIHSQSPKLQINHQPFIKLNYWAVYEKCTLLVYSLTKFIQYTQHTHTYIIYMEKYIKYLCENIEKKNKNTNQFYLFNSITTLITIKKKKKNTYEPFNWTGRFRFYYFYCVYVRWWRRVLCMVLKFYTLK